MITVNPATGKQLKEGTLQAVYTLGDKVVTYTMVKNSAGQYVLHMPAANVVFKAEFGMRPQHSQRRSNRLRAQGLQACRPQARWPLQFASTTMKR